VLFGRGQHARQADHDQMIEHVGLNVLGSPAHVVLLEATDPLADGGFDFSLRFQSNLNRLANWVVSWENNRTSSQAQVTEPVILAL
jgi:hypothetical protein